MHLLKVWLPDLHIIVQLTNGEDREAKRSFIILLTIKKWGSLLLMLFWFRLLVGTGLEFRSPVLMSEDKGKQNHDTEIQIIIVHIH